MAGRLVLLRREHCPVSARAGHTAETQLPICQGLPEKLHLRIQFGHISDPAFFLRSRNYPIRIKVLAYSQIPCSQSYPQKVCRTLLAVQLATRYIAGFDVTSFLT
jgi:hypothetical protein